MESQPSNDSRDERLLDGSPLHHQMCQPYLYLGSSTRVIMYHVSGSVPSAPKCHGSGTLTVDVGVPERGLRSRADRDGVHVRAGVGEILQLVDEILDLLRIHVSHLSQFQFNHLPPTFSQCCCGFGSESTGSTCF